MLCITIMIEIPVTLILNQNKLEINKTKVKVGDEQEDGLSLIYRNKLIRIG